MGSDCLKLLVDSSIIKCYIKTSAIYTSRVVRQYGIFQLKEKLSWRLGTLQYFLGTKVFVCQYRKLKCFSICLIKDFVKPHKISAHSDNIQRTFFLSGIKNV
jgi:hypothetical protein